MKKQRVVVGRTSHEAALKYHLDFDIFTLDLKLMKVSHHLLLLLIWRRAEQLHWLRCEAHCKRFVPVPTLMMLPLDFWANFEEISSLFMQKWAAAVCRHLIKLQRGFSFITCMHWVCVSSFHVAIKSLLWGSLLRSWISPLLVGQMGSSLFLVERWVRVYLGHKQEMSTVWYERAVRAVVWKDMSQCDASLLQCYGKKKLYK